MAIATCSGEMEEVLRDQAERGERLSDVLARSYISCNLCEDL
jgi:hypothetical protein